MTKTELKTLLTRLKLNPSRKLGQNFLIDDNMLDAIVREADPTPADHVLEIGPGTGVLTRKLLATKCRVTAVEYDRRLAEFLQNEFGSCNNFTLVAADACRVDLAELVGTLPWRCISNLPYAVSTPVIMRMVALENRPTDMLLLLQKEAGERFAAAPTTKDYGGASVIVQHFYNVRLVRNIPKTVFHPQPEIGSALVAFTPAENAEAATRTPAADTAKIIQIIRSLFGQRRKRLFKNAAAFLDKHQLENIFTELEIPRDARAEQLPPDTLWLFAEKLNQ